MLQWSARGDAMHVAAQYCDVWCALDITLDDGRPDWLGVCPGSTTQGRWRLRRAAMVRPLFRLQRALGALAAVQRRGLLGARRRSGQRVARRYHGLGDKLDPPARVGLSHSAKRQARCCRSSLFQNKEKRKTNAHYTRCKKQRSRCIEPAKCFHVGSRHDQGTRLRPHLSRAARPTHPHRAEPPRYVTQSTGSGLGHFRALHRAT